MEYFKCLAQNIDIAPLLEEIKENEEAWTENTVRQDTIPVQKQTQTIYIRQFVPRSDLMIMENQESYWTDTSKKFPKCSAFMDTVAKKMGGSLSRATIVRLQPKGNVLLHIDDGAYYFIRKRLHLVLKSEQGSVLMSGGETVKMKEGELWWFDNRQHHQAMNTSDDWRIHFIFDILPDKYKELAKNPLPLEEVSAKVGNKPPSE